MRILARWRPWARTPLLAAFATLAAAAPAHASFVQEAGSPYAVGTDPYGVVSADFDGNGQPDAAAINGTSSNLSVLLREPAGGFAQEAGSPFATGGGPSFGAVADFNADGRPDVAVAAFTGASATIMLRQAGGGFTAESGSPGPGGRASAVAAADFNADGRPDVAVANWDGATISVFLRQANNTFAQEGTAIAVGTNPRYLVASDFNGDGRPDLAVANLGSSTVTILLRQASGGFAQEAGSPIAVGAAPLNLASADFNGDARPDLAVTSNSDGTVTVLLRQAAGGFAADAGSPIALTRAYGVAAADFNGDGRPDLAVSSDLANTLTVFLNTTAAPTPLPLPAAPAPPVAGR